MTFPIVDDDTVTVEIPTEVVTEAVEETEPQIDPNALLAADVEIARQQEETERARIDARMQIKIAEIRAEDDAWRSEMRASLESLGARMMALEEKSSTPVTSVVTVVETEPEPTPEPEPEPVEEEVMPEPNAVPEEPAPARPRRRWI